MEFIDRSGWKPGKPDGTVNFTCFVEQLVGVEPGMIVHVIERSKEALRVLKKVGRCCSTP